MHHFKILKHISVSAFRYFILVGLSFLILYPIAVTFMISVMNTSDFSNSAVRYISMAPSFVNYETVINFLQYWKMLSSSTVLCVSLCLLEVASSLLIAYGFARFNFKGSSILFGCVILTLLVPSSIYFTPLYLSLQSYGPFGWNLLETQLPLYLFSACALGPKNGLIIYIFRQFFKGYPKELEEAAAIDGAGTFKIFTKIMLPGSVSVSVTAFMLTFVFHWTDPTYTEIFLPDMQYIWTKLSTISSDMVAMAGVAQDDFYYRAILKNTAIILYVLPILILFLFGKRCLVDSVETTGLVG